jgi:hypothetical protein
MYQVLKNLAPSDFLLCPCLYNSLFISENFILKVDLHDVFSNYQGIALGEVEFGLIKELSAGISNKDFDSK